MNDTIIFSVFADLHWREGDWTWCEARLDAIFARALRERAEFIIHCGDFCHDVAAARGMIAKYAAAPHPRINEPTCKIPICTHRRDVVSLKALNDKGARHG